MNNKNKIKISAGLNYFLHKRCQEHIKEKNISLTYLVEVALEVYFEEERKSRDTKRIEEQYMTLAEILLEMNQKLENMKNGK